MMRNLPDILDSCINKELDFAACRVPGSDLVRFVSQGEGSPEVLRSIRDLNGKRGFAIAPFRITEACPAVLIRPDREELIPFGGGSDMTDVGDYDGRPVDGQYAERFEAFMKPVRERRFKKLVLSRKMTIGRDESFSPGEAFRAACGKYERSYVYIFNTKATGCWMGCTPEILLSGEGDEWETVALAGTRRAVAESSNIVWDDKNLIEQMLVAHYIRSQLASLGINADENGPYTVRAGGVAHLKTNFRFRLPEICRLGDLLELLHPTPAVAGLPKEEAVRFIHANEGYDRKYYSGFAGWIDPDGRSDLYVNLRCMNIRADSLALYAGGGLLPSSVLEDEWRETEDKLQTILSVTIKPH